MTDEFFLVVMITDLYPNHEKWLSTHERKLAREYGKLFSRDNSNDADDYCHYSLTNEGRKLAEKLVSIVMDAKK